MTFLSHLPFFSAATAVLLAIAVAWRPHGSTARWGFVAGMLILGLEQVGAGMAAIAATAGECARWHAWRVLASALVPGTWLAFSLAYGRGDSRDALLRARFLLGLALLVPVGVAAAFHSSLVEVGPSLTAEGNPQYTMGRPGAVVHFLLLTIAVIVLMNLEQTFRRSTGVLRWRVKFMLFGLGLLFIVRIFTGTHALLFHGVSAPLGEIDSAALLVAALLILRSLFRRGHFETNVYLSHAVLRHSLTVLFVGLYLLSVGLVAQITYRLNGEVKLALTAFIIPVALVVLGILLQSDRLRVDLHRFVSRNFHRPVFDYQAVWRKFTRHTASYTEQADLCRALARLLGEFLDALSVTIWLVEPGRQAFVCGASTAVSVSSGRRLDLEPGDLRKLMTFFQQQPEALDLEKRPEGWAKALRQWPASQFPHGGNRIGVPMIVRGELLGLVTVGDRVGGGPFGPAEFDLLKCVADHSATALLNAQLAQRLLEATQLEAFQTMAAFFVHDLKNTASTLNLMVQNLHVHFDNPAFRQDALRGLTKTMGHMNQLVSRLGTLRHELKVALSAGDLNAVVGHALDGCEKSGPTIVREFRPLPPLALDAEQMDKVVTNLVHNAIDAVGPGGRVQVATRPGADSVVLSVNDNGCGMSQEFIANSLFHPFRTTKATGLGIGMFQSKMIVEAHGGWIAVSSERGRGTTIEVHLPAGSAGRESRPPTREMHVYSTSGAA